MPRSRSPCPVAVKKLDWTSSRSSLVAVLIALEFRDQGRRLGQRQHFLALPRGQVRDLAGDIPVLGVAVGVQPNVGSQPRRSALDAQIVAQVQGRPQLLGHDGQVDRSPPATPPCRRVGGIEPSPVTERHRARQLELVDRPGVVESLAEFSRAGTVSR